MDTDIVTTASASTTTLQDSSSILQQDKLVSDIKPLSFLNKDLDFDDSNSSSKLLEGVVKQEPMSVDTVCSNKGKDMGYAHSDTASTPISTSNCTAPPLGPAPIRGSKPKRGVLSSYYYTILRTLYLYIQESLAVRGGYVPENCENVKIAKGETLVQ